jgi:AcrR family transcriptional regulator
MTALQERKRQAAVDHLVASALGALIEHGPNVTVEEIAHMAGVSRRTVFRHFATREELLAEALRALLPKFDQSLPHYGGDDNWRPWLSELCRALHLAFMTFRRVFWELMTRGDLSTPLATVTEEIVRTRQQRNQAIADTLWRAVGHDGVPPQDFRATVIAHLSPFFAMAVNCDVGGDHVLAASLAEAAILDMVDKHSPTRPSPQTN